MGCWRQTSTPKLPVAKAIHEMIVDHADGLHEGVANGAADKLEAAFLEIFAHGLGFASLVGHFLDGLPSVLLGLMANKFPNVSIKSAKLVLNGQKCFGVLYGGIDLKGVSNDTRVGE